MSHLARYGFSGLEHQSRKRNEAIPIESAYEAPMFDLPCALAANGAVQHRSGGFLQGVMRTRQ
ncbi:hypothetical protein [Cupriavidus sp. TMH.W2]|uniref:hypothetical protein n=1 Tax=Cupriavidus sp. TMH.W2 TaxID=3434465 RepID=UPI003D787FDB